MAVVWWAGEELPDDTLFADRNICVDKSGLRVVAENSVESASQLVAKGHPIPVADVERLGLFLVDGVIVQRAAASETVSESLAYVAAEPVEPVGSVEE